MSEANGDAGREGGALAFLLGDQLSPDLSALDGLDPERDAVWMAELSGEIERIPSHKVRIVAFLSAMRHARDELRERGWTVHYQELATDPNPRAAGRPDDAGASAPTSMVYSLAEAVRRLQPERIVLTRPGSWRVLHALRSAAGRLGVPLEIREDTRFLSSPDHFAGWAAERKRLVLEDFLEHRLPIFGRFQDAMWSDRPFLAHSRLSVPLNLGLLDPHRCIRQAERAYRQGRAPLAAVEGFVRQILGWREYVRGLYWHHMPDYASMNALNAEHDVPAFLWDGETEMECVRQAMAGVLDHAYAHHIQRLMVLGLFCLLHGVDPARFNDWHLAMYADAVDQVSMPNTLGMSQFADGRIVGTKPYCASGRYIDRMSDHCRHCPFDPTKATGDAACPFTTLYWDFLARHEGRLRANRRMNFQYANLDRKEGDELEAIRSRATSIRERIAAGGRV